MNREILERGKNETFRPFTVEYSCIPLDAIRFFDNLDSAIMFKIERGG